MSLCVYVFMRIKVNNDVLNGCMRVKTLLAALAVCMKEWMNE